MLTAGDLCTISFGRDVTGSGALTCGARWALDRGSGLGLRQLCRPLDSDGSGEVELWQFVDTLLEIQG